MVSGRNIRINSNELKSITFTVFLLCVTPGFSKAGTAFAAVRG
jgi:hypothetical protein